MPYEIVMPRLGWNMEEGTLVEWLKQDGETVRQGETVCTIEGDKAATDIESFESGILKIPDASPPPGKTVPVGTLLGYIVSEKEVGTFDPNVVRADDEGGEGVAVGPAEGTAPARVKTTGLGQDGSVARAPVVGIRSGALREQDEPAISPRARRAARSAGIDWRRLRGSGRSGRIVERDVLEAARQREIAVDGADGKAAGRGDMRRIIARRMTEAHRTTAPVTLNTEVDVTALTSFFQGTFRPSWYDLMARITAVALTDHPVMNASWRNGVTFNEGINIGIAVDTPGGVIAPVIRDVPGKSLQDISAASKRLIEAAQSGSLTLDQIEDGTFTLTNLGMYDIDAFTPIIHHLQCAILGLGRTAPRVVVLDEASGATGIRRMMTLSLTFDHRIVDGAPAARFLQRIRQLAEEPESVFGKADGIQTRPS